MSGTWALPEETASATAVAEAVAVAEAGAEGAPVLAPAVADDDAPAEGPVTSAHTMRSVVDIQGYCVPPLLTGRELYSAAGAQEADRTLQCARSEGQGGTHVTGLSR